MYARPGNSRGSSFFEGLVMRSSTIEREKRQLEQAAQRSGLFGRNGFLRRSTTGVSAAAIASAALGLWGSRPEAGN